MLEEGKKVVTFKSLAGVFTYLLNFVLKRKKMLIIVAIFQMRAAEISRCLKFINYFGFVC